MNNTTQEIADAIRASLKQRFPWLGTEDEANGCDVIDALNQWYAELGRDEAPDTCDHCHGPLENHVIRGYGVYCSHDCADNSLAQHGSD